MHITRIELENIKSYESALFEFSLGTTAITGDNGAGKTTLIEAVAWTLFGVLDYKKEEFVRRGAKKGSVRVSFESNLDQREYTVYRDTGTGYYVHDNVLKNRIADKKEEVTRFLWLHLGVEPGTNLESLFKHAIGVPQGTFTAIFLATPADRKRTFDALLKVEEYRRGAEELLKTQRFVDGEIAVIRERIARSEGEVARYEIIESEHAAAVAEVERLENVEAQFTRELTEKEDQAIVFEERSAAVERTSRETEKLNAAAERAELLFVQQKADLERSEAAFAITEQVRAEAAEHSTAVQELKELESKRNERDRLRSELAEIEKRSASLQTDERHAAEAAESIAKARAVLKELRPKLDDAERIEAEIKQLREEHSLLKISAGKAEAAEKELALLRERYKRMNDSLIQTREQAKTAEKVPELQSLETEIINRLANLNAKLERDRQFQSEIKNGLCPILSEKCLNLKEGQTLESFLGSQFDDSQTEIATLTAKHKDIAASLRSARESEKAAANVAQFETALSELRAEGEERRVVFENLKAEAAGLGPAAEKLRIAEERSRSLSDVRSRSAVLTGEIAREAQIQNRLDSIGKQKIEIFAESERVSSALQKFSKLDELLQNASQKRDSTAEADRIFRANLPDAEKLDERRLQFGKAEKELQNALRQASEAAVSAENAAKEYDRDGHLQLKTEIVELQRKRAEAKAMADAERRRKNERETELKRLDEIKDSLAGEFAEKEHKEKVLEAVVFIRDTLKDAAPLVARNYVHHVSLEANLMFREITGNAERSLKWAEDYGIILEEYGHERPFVSLSGGEQMAAALSVRLALLKQLSDIRIAFFDEPTTNMDAERRENLAMQVSQITHFDQLFVISHDDTFEGYMDHELRIGD